MSGRLSPGRGECRGCHRDVAVRHDGLVRVHLVHGERCGGSNCLPGADLSIYADVERLRAKLADAAASEAIVWELADKRGSEIQHLRAAVQRVSALCDQAEEYVKENTFGVDYRTPAFLDVAKVRAALDGEAT